MSDNIQGELGGLTSEQAAKRLQQFGPNIIAKERRRRMEMLLGKFWGIVPWMLELAIILDLVLQRWVEAIIIIGWLVFSALLGYYQENRAQQALALLRQHLTINARVLRDGIWNIIPASELVPNDLIYLRTGDIVPADVNLTDGQIQVNQSQLTGESLPVERTADNVIYAGSLVTRGEAKGVITATGARTYFGKTAELVRTAKAPARLEILIIGVAKYLASFDIILAVAVLANALYRGLPLVGVLPFVILLLVVSVPVAAPMMFTMSASIGSRMLAKNGILVTRLSAIEDAATMDVLCLDKTGTITENRLTVAKVQAFAQTTEEEVINFAAQASDQATQDPIDLAVLNAAQEKKLISPQLSRLKFTPFDPNTKCSEALMQQGDRTLRVIKGEPLTVAKLTQTDLSKITENIAQLTAEGNRVLAVAVGTEQSLRLIGLVSLNDPIRPDSKKLIADLKNKGIRVLLVTGDNEATALTVAKQVGIGGEVAPHGTIREGIDSAVIDKFAIFARVLPQDKFLLVQALQKAGHVVGMTGDGVNDAPALKQSDVGIAVSNSSDVAKAASSLVLSQRSLDGIIMAIEGSRKIYQRMQSWLLAMITRKLSVPPFLSVGVIIFGAFVLNPLLMVLFMFTGDVTTFALSMDKVIPSPRPDRWVIRILVRTGLIFAAILFLVDIAVFWAAGNILQLNPSERQTLVFVWLVFGSGQAVIYLTRARSFFWRKPYPGQWLIIATVTTILFTVIMASQGWLMSPISLPLVGSMLILAIAFLICADIFKIILLKAHNTSLE